MTDQTSPGAGDEPARTAEADAEADIDTAEADPEAAIDTAEADAEAAIEAARRRVAEAPAEVVVVNHVMGLYELAAIHLSAPRPDLAAAALAIDAVACLVEGLGDRLGSESATMRDALANIRLAFVQIKARAATETSAADGGAESGAEPPAG